MFCLIQLDKVNLEKELLLWMLLLLSPCVTSTLLSLPFQLRASLNPGHRALARVVPTGVISLQDCLWPGFGKENRNGLSAYRAEITARCRGVQGWSRTVLRADRGAAPSLEQVSLSPWCRHPRLSMAAWTMFVQRECWNPLEKLDAFLA